ncbi:unnamed protein product [Phytomonas sp. EM1]|nr:unnamed protein product [Phytomonas sp. EM1]|eukprot:CCW65061.1 unnamed protein product [Phytomonas sp. isolate EM1]
MRALLDPENGSVPFRSSLEGAAQASLCSAPLPSPNCQYKRAHYGRPLFQAAPEEPALPALLRSQFCSLTEPDLRWIEQSMQLRGRSAARDAAIEQRVEMARAQRRAVADTAAARVQRRAERHAAAAGKVFERSNMAEYRKMCRW